MILHKSGERPANRASADYFTGTVWAEPINEAPDPARMRAVKVTFEAGGRTNWHTHPLGQTLYVISGEGRFQTEGDAVRVLRPGDTVWIPPEEKHWHGASASTAMCHIAIHEALDGTHITWMEPVSDTDFTRAPDT